MKRQEHSPAYVLQIKKQWRVVVPVRGNLRLGYALWSSPPVPMPRHGSAAMRESAPLVLTEAASFGLRSAQPHRASGQVEDLP